MKTKILAGIMMVGFAGMLFSAGALQYFDDIEVSNNNVIDMASMEKRCGYLGKVAVGENGDLFIEDKLPSEGEYPQNVFKLNADDGSGAWSRIEMIPREWKDNETGELLKFDFMVLEGNSICKVNVKAATENNLFDFDCSEGELGLETPSYGENVPKAISHITFYYCEYYWAS